MILETYRERSKFIKRLIFWSIVIGGLFALFFSQTIVNAQSKPIDLCDSSQQTAIGGCIGGIENYSGGTTANNITKLIIDIVRFLIYIGFAVAILFIVLGGYNMITSNGNPDMYKKGLNTLVYACIGLVIAIIAVTIVSLVGNITSTLSLNSSSTTTK